QQNVRRVDCVVRSQSPASGQPHLSHCWHPPDCRGGRAGGAVGLFGPPLARGDYAVRSRVGVPICWACVRGQAARVFSRLGGSSSWDCDGGSRRCGAAPDDRSQRQGTHAFFPNSCQNPSTVRWLETNPTGTTMFNLHEFLALFERIRERTRRVASCIPPDKVEW